MQKTAPLEILSSKTVFENLWETLLLEQVRDATGKEWEYLLSKTREYAVIIPCLPDHSIVLLRQYKHGVRRPVLTLPAGYMEKGETPEACARRELWEETGYHTPSVRPIGSLTENHTRSRSFFHVFVAHNISHDPHHESNPDDTEGNGEMIRLPPHMLLQADVIRDIPSAPILASILLASSKGALNLSPPTTP